MTTPPNSSAPQPKKLEPWVIVVVVVVVACCLCFGAIGLFLAFGGPILTEIGIRALVPILMSIP